MKKIIKLDSHKSFSESKLGTWNGSNYHSEMSLDEIAVSITVNGQSIEVNLPAEHFIKCTASVMFQSPAYVLSRMLYIAIQEAGIPHQLPKEPEYLYVPKGNKFWVRPIKTTWRETISESDEGYAELSAKEFAQLALTKGVKLGK